MIRPPVRPLLGAAAGLVLWTGGVANAAAPASPAAPAQAEPAKPKPGWVNRLAAESKKLAFWDKDKDEPAPAAPAAAPTAPAKKPPAPSAAQTKPRGGSTAQRPRATDRKPEPPAPVPAEPAPPKKSIFSKLPALPFIGKEKEAAPGTAPASSPAPAPAAAPPKKKGVNVPQPAAATTTPKRSGAAPSGEGEPVPPEEKKPGFFELGRLWPGARKSGAPEATPDAPATVAEQRERKTTKPLTTPADTKPGAKPASPSADPAAGEPEKLSLWARMAAAITPKAPVGEKPATAPVPKGLAPLGATAPDTTTFVITKDDSPFYTFGPQQATPPDAYLPTGTVVTMTAKNWGWASVQLTDGRTGVVDRAALRPALITDLIPNARPGDALMASLSPGQLNRKATPNFVLPAAEMPDLPTSGDASATVGNPLLLPFSPDDVTDPGQLPPLPDIPPLPEPPATDAPGSESADTPPPPAPAPPEPAEPAPSGEEKKSESEEAPAEPEPAGPAPEPADSESSNP